MRTVLLALAVVLGGCAKNIVLPNTREAQQCGRECQIVFNTCVANPYGALHCQGQKDDCLLTCPGAYEVASP